MERTERNFPRRLLSELPTSLLLLTGLLPIFAFVAGFIIQIHTIPANTRFVLSTLAGAQASVLAIVFSVTVIGIQLAGDRYSPRMIALFVESPILTFTFTLFIFSIAVDISLLFNVPSSTDRLHQAAVFAATGLSLSAAVTLYSFIKTAIRKSTPEGIIDAFVNDLTPDEYLNRTEQAVEDDLKNVHPLQPLYAMTMEALSNRRRATADIALKNYGHLAVDTLEEFERRGTFEQCENRVAKKLFKPVLEEHLPRIALHAEEQDESQLVSDAVEWIHDIGKAGLNLPEPTASRQAIWGFRDVILGAPVDAGEYISVNNALRQLGELLVEAAEHPEPEIVWTAASTIRGRVPYVLWKAHDRRRLEHSMLRIFRRMEMAHEHLLDHYSEDVARVEMNWHHEHVPDDAPNRQAISSVHRLREAFLKTTEAFLQYLDEEGQYPIAEGNFRSVWKDICITASNSATEEYAIALCQALIEVSFIASCIDPSDESWWIDAIARVKHKGDAEVVDKAFERILSYDAREREGPIIGTVDEDERVGEEYYLNLVNVQDYRPLNTHPEFPDRVRRIRDEAEKQKRDFG